jgi:hypothetical protein
VHRPRVAPLLLAALLASSPPLASGEEIRLPGEGSAGSFDPSFAQAPGEARVWMAHSIVEHEPALPGRSKRTVSIAIAHTDDGGQTWRSDPRLAAASIPVHIRGERAEWQAEVSTLFHDPAAPAAERWKLLFHRYLHHDGRRRFEHGWLSLKVAAQPGRLADAREHKFLVGRGYDAVNDRADPWTASPLAGPPHIDARAPFAASLGRCVTFTEPGAHATSDAVLVVAMCPEFRLLAGVRNRIIALRCAQPCRYLDASAWQVLGDLLRPADARKAGIEKFGAPELSPTPRGLRLWVTPVSRRPFPDAYRGCLAYELDANGIVRADGVAVASLRVEREGAIFYGACDAHPAVLGGGALVSVLELERTRMFGIWSTDVGAGSHR